MAPSGSPILMFPTIQTTPPRFRSAPSAARIDPAWQTTIAPLVAYLRTQQFTEQNGWHPDDPVYGAWGMGGGRRTPPNTGHVDLSMTRYVLNALHAAGAADSDPAFTAARIFVERCQNLDDGGFFFSTTEVDTNKAGQSGDHFRSYGTTTADGIAALLATGHSPEHDRVAAARQWLVSHHRDMAVPGFVGEAYQRWPKGLAFYYSAASAQAFRQLHVDAGSRGRGWFAPFAIARRIVGQSGKSGERG